MKFFDPNEELQITRRRLPHWAQDGTLCFITWRTRDSIPKSIVRKWLADRDAWLRAHAIDPTKEGWRGRLRTLAADKMMEFHDRFTSRWHDELDACHGACVLRDPGLAQIVADSLLHFDGERYEMHGFVIMPNHVHVLAVFEDREMMLKQCESWKRFTGRAINAQIGDAGRFWQPDAFDHLVRSEAQFARLREYLAENPVKAGLEEGEFVLYVRPEVDPSHGV